MATPHTFASAKPDPVQLAPIDFTLTGYTASLEPEEWSESFKAKGWLPPGSLLDLGTLIESNPDGSVRYNLRAVRSFMARVLLDAEQVARFMALINDEHRMVELEALAAAVQFLAEQTSGRPTGRSSG